MKIDTSQTTQLQAPASTWRNVATLTCIAAIFLAVAAGNYSLGGTTPALASLALVVVCAWGALSGMRYILRGDKIRLTLAPSGLTDSRLSGDEISWSAVRDVGIWRHGKTEQVILRLSEPSMRRRHSTFLSRCLRLGNRIVDGDGVLVPQYPFGWSAEKLRDLIKAYADRYSEKSRRY